MRRNPPEKPAMPFLFFVTAQPKREELLNAKAPRWPMGGLKMGLYEFPQYRRSNNGFPPVFHVLNKTWPSWRLGV